MTPLVVLMALTIGSDAEWHPVSPMLPRNVTLGVTWNDPAVAPTIRATWEATFYEQPRNHLIGVFTLGTGASGNLPKGIGALWQHVAWAGIGYASTRASGLHWGFSFGGGVLWYRSFYAPGSVYQPENRVLGYSEGRLQIGFKVARKLILGVSLGYGAPWDLGGIFPDAVYLGGWQLAVFGDWR